VLQFAVEHWRGGYHGSRNVGPHAHSNGNHSDNGHGDNGSRSSSGSVSPVDGQRANLVRVDLGSIQPYGLSLMVLDFIKSQVGADESTLDELSKKARKLYRPNFYFILSCSTSSSKKV
jgi:hypothetical protein